MAKPSKAFATRRPGEASTVGTWRMVAKLANENFEFLLFCVKVTSYYHLPSVANILIKTQQCLKECTNLYKSFTDGKA